MKQKQEKIQGEAKWSANDRRLALGLLAADPLFRRIPIEDIRPLLDSSLAFGAEKAEQTRIAYRTNDPLKIARLLGVKVIFDITRPVRPNAFTPLASYSQTPPSITVYENTVRHVKERLQVKSTLSAGFLASLTQMCVAHEIYHHIEYMGHEYLNLAYKVPVFSFAGLTIEKSLGALSEIAANAFATRLMGLPTLPCVVHDFVKATAD